MKKQLVLSIVLILVFCCAACTDKDIPAAASEPEPEAEPVFNPLTHLEVSAPIEKRMILVSIDNHPDARPQYGISAADIVYEIPAEGCIPRLLCLFYSEAPDIIGPVRSARPYMVDIAREWDALFVHCGGSEDALDYLYAGVVDNMNEFAWDSYFWRDKTRYAPHNLMTSGEKLYAYLTARGMDTVTVMSRKFEFLDEEEAAYGAEKADWINVRYDYADNYYYYNAQISCYNRLIDDEAFIDAATGDTLKISNIIVQKVTSRVADSLGHLTIDMCAGGEAWLFTGGTVTKGSWSRADLESPTLFVDDHGGEFRLNPGQTWIEVIDQNASLSYKDSAAVAILDAGAE